MRAPVSLALAAAVLLAAALPAWAAVTGQQLGGSPSYNLFSGDPPIAADSAGRTYGVVSVRRHLALVTARRGRRFAAPKLLPGADGSTAPALAVAPDGAVAVAWVRNDGSLPAEPDSRDDDCCDRVRAAVVRPGGRRSRTRTLSGGYYEDDGPLATANGSRAAVAFRDGLGVRVATASTRSVRGFGRPVRLTHAGTPLHLWLVGRTPHLLGLTQVGGSKVRAVELFRRKGRTVRRVRTRAFTAGLYDPSVTSSRDGRLLAVFDRAGDRHVLLQRARSGRVRVRVLPGSAQAVAVALSDHHGWIAAAERRTVRLSRADERGPRRHAALRPGGRQFTTDLALGVDDRGRGALAGYDGGRRSRRLVVVLGPGLRPLRRFSVAPSKPEYFGPETGVSVLPERGGRALVAFARDDVRAVRVGP